MSAYHQIRSWPPKGVPDHRKRVGHPAPCGPAFRHNGFGDWFLDWIGDDTRQCIDALNQGTNIQGAEEVTIETRNTAKAAEAVGQEHVHAHDLLCLRQRPAARL